MSEYEKLRMENIARNRGFLTKLGFDSNNKQRSMAAIDDQRREKKRKIQYPSAIPEEFMRRSARLSTLPQADYKELSTIVVDGQRSYTTSRRRQPERKDREPPVIAANNSKALDANLEPFLAEVRRSFCYLFIVFWARNSILLIF